MDNLKYLNDIFNELTDGKVEGKGNEWLIEHGAMLLLTGITGDGKWKNDPEMKDTPKRITDSLLELTRGYRELDFNVTIFPTTSRGIVIRSPIPFTSLCAHHMLPYSGVAHVGLIYKNKKYGLSKIIRLVQHYCARLTSQEELTDLLVDKFYECIPLKGCIVVLEAYHLCEACRGVRVPDVMTITESFKGVFKLDATRSEFYQRLKDGK